MASGLGSESAVQRCPIELWHMILRIATDVPPKPYYGIHWDESFPNELLDGQEVLSSSAATFRRIRLSHSVALNCARTCRSWYDICCPFLLERLVLTHNPRDSPLTVLSGKFKGRERGQLVKSLSVIDFRAESVSSFLDACTHLEQFIFHEDFKSPESERLCAISSLTLQILASRCSHTLRCIEVHVQFPFPLASFCDLILACARLEEVSCSAWEFSQSQLNGTTDGRTLALRSISWGVDEADITNDNRSQSVFFGFLSSFRMPFLRRLAVVDYGPYEEDERAPDSESFMYDLLRRYGAQLRYVQFERKTERKLYEPTSAVVSSVLETCPNLRVLDLALLLTEPLPSHVGHSSLRELVCSAFLPMAFSFVRPDDLPDLAHHVRRVLDAFFTERFPALEVIVLTELQPATTVSDTWPHECRWTGEMERMCYIPSEFVLLLQEVWGICSARGIRLEDSTGQLVGLDVSSYSPVESWCFTFQEEQFDYGG